MSLYCGGQWGGYGPKSDERDSPGAVAQANKTANLANLSSSGPQRTAPPTLFRLDKSALTSTIGTVFRYAIRDGGFVELEEAMELER